MLSPKGIIKMNITAIYKGFPGGASGKKKKKKKNSPASAGDVRDAGSIPELRRVPGGGHGKPLQYSCLENPMDRGASRALVNGVAKCWTRLKQLSMQTHAIYKNHLKIL